jgi:hypothetical protein
MPSGPGLATFYANTFASRTFAARTFRGVPAAALISSGQSITAFLEWERRKKKKKQALVANKRLEEVLAAVDDFPF